MPLSHVASQMVDIVSSLSSGGEVVSAHPSALQGTLVEQLKEVKPTRFFGVPRVWEKISEKIKAVAASNGMIKKAIGIGI